MILFIPIVLSSLLAGYVTPWQHQSSRNRGVSNVQLTPNGFKVNVDNSLPDDMYLAEVSPTFFSWCPVHSSSEEIYNVAFGGACHSNHPHKYANCGISTTDGRE